MANPQAKPETKRQTFTSEAIPSDVKSGVFLGNPQIDNLVSCVVAMGAELWTTKRRLKVVEAVAKGGRHGRHGREVPAFDQELAAWEADRDRFISLTLGSLGNDGTRGFGADFPPRD
ncbi:MAG: hypothetical protein IPG25_13565 [Proteobacteria bacterium]|nr:hypothetical protein [Pseudomonadota bacterium]